MSIVDKNKSMIDNIDLIAPLLNFDDPNDFYMLYIFKRKKDQPEGEKDNHQSVRTVKLYCINSIEYLHSIYEESKMLCEVFKARAYIHVQKQNHKDVSLEINFELAKRLKNNVINQQNLFESVVSKVKIYEKRWVVDVDSLSTSNLTRICSDINHIRPQGKDKIVQVIPTKQGYHIISTPFDVDAFKDRGHSAIGIQKKNPTLLYYPQSLE